MDEALAAMKIDMPEHFVDERGNAFVRAPGGYVLESMEKNRDVSQRLRHWTFRIKTQTWMSAPSVGVSERLPTR